MMLALLVDLIVISAAGPGVDATAADAITLRDGKVVLGQVVEPAPRGKVLVAVRRAWAEAHLPEWAKRWEAAEAPAIKRARAQRLERLRDWRREREPNADRDDEVLAWIVAEIDRLGQQGDEPPPLMLVALNRSDVRAVSRRPKDAARMLRQGWRGRFKDVEEMPVADLKSALEGRGFALSDVDPAPLDPLLPIPIETDRRWLARRAATEVQHEPALRFVRHQGLVLPEGTPGEGAALKTAASALATLLGGDQAGDPMTPHAREAAARGRVGLVVTRLDMAPDFSRITVDATLWVRTGPDRWEPAFAHPVTVRPADLRADAGDALAADPQVQAAFRVFQGLGLGDLPPAVKQQSLNVGAACRQAMGTAKSELAKDLDALALPVRAPSRPEAR
jgi:hypothetical protein